MKNSKTIVVLSLILLGLLLFALIFELPSEKYDDSKDEISRPLIADLTTEEVAKIQIMKSDENIIMEKMGEGEEASYVLKGEEDSPASQDLVNGFLDTLVNLKSGVVVSFNEDKHVEFGVNSELGTRVTLFSGEEEKIANIVIGNTADSGGTYIKNEGEPEVYLVKTYIKSEVQRDANAWRDKTIISFDKENAREVSIKSGDQKAVFNTDSEGNWRKLEVGGADMSVEEGAEDGESENEEDGEGEESGIAAVVTSLSALKGFEIVDSTDFAAYNLEDGSEDTKVYIKFTEGEDKILIIGYANEEYYARDLRKDIIYKIAQLSVDEIKSVL